MSYFMFPVIGADTLRNEVNIQYGVDIEDICDLLFKEDRPIDDQCCYFNYDELDEYNGYVWEDEEEIRLTNLVKAYLKDILPDYVSIIIDPMI